MEIRVTIEVLDENGKTVWKSDPILAEHDERGLQGEVEQALDEAVLWIEGEEAALA